jgi:hypothetical protein
VAWKPIYENEQVSLIVDEDKQNLMFEVNSGGYTPRYVTLHWNESELAELIQALQNAQQSLKGTRA